MGHGAGRFDAFELAIQVLLRSIVLGSAPD